MKTGYIYLEYLLPVWITVVTSTLGKEPWLVFLMSSSIIKCQTSRLSLYSLWIVTNKETWWQSTAPAGVYY